MIRQAILIALALSACKTPNSGSRVATLDNFARDTNGTIEGNVCSGEYGKDFDLYWGTDATDKDRIYVDSPFKADLKETIKTTLSAVPDDLQAWFFDKGGRLIITTKASAFCAARNAARKLTGLTGAM